MYVHACAIVHVHAACTPRQASEMEPSHPKTPTVIPLTRNLIEQILKPGFHPGFSSRGGANVVIVVLRGGNNYSSIFSFFLSERENYSTQLN